MSDPHLLEVLEKYGPRCSVCPNYATRMAVPREGYTAWVAWCGSFSHLFQVSALEGSELPSEIAQDWIRRNVLVLYPSGEAPPSMSVYRIKEGDGWFYCDRHKHPDFEVYGDLERADLVRGLDDPGPEVIRPTRFERILDA